MKLTRRELIGVGASAVVGGSVGCSEAAKPVAPAAANAAVVKATVQSRLQAHFSGLCVAAVQTDGSDPTKLGDAKILMPDPCQFQTYGKGIAGHKPLLCVPKSFYASTGPTDTDCKIHDAWAWPLDGVDVSFLVSSAPVTGPVSTFTAVPEAEYPDYPYGDGWRDTKWLVHLNDAAGGPVKVLYDYATKAPSKGVIACRVNLNGGTLGGAVPRKWRGRFLIRHWGGSGKPKDQMMTDTVLYESPIGDAFQVQLTAADGTKTTVDLKVPADGAPIKIFFQNLVPAKPKCSMTNKNHFQGYYELLATKPKYHPQPTNGVVADVKSCDQIDDDPIYCPPPVAEY